MPVDYLGGLFFAGALTTLAIALTDDPVAARPVWVNVTLYLASAVFAAAFIWRERVAKTPMLALSLFRSIARPATSCTQWRGLIVAMVSVPVLRLPSGRFSRAAST
jgi:hypothetical protein